VRAQYKFFLKKTGKFLFDFKEGVFSAISTRLKNYSGLYCTQHGFVPGRLTPEGVRSQGRSNAQNHPA
jgi:hypothetical protein